MKHEMALLETAASNLEKGDEMSFIWLNQWQKHNFLFKEARGQKGGHLNVRGMWSILWVVGKQEEKQDKDLVSEVSLS